MSTQQTAWQAGESAASVLGPEANLLASADAAGLGASTLAVLRRAARKPGATGTAALRYWTSLALAGPVATARWLGVDVPPPVPAPAGDRRFADPAWTGNPAFFAVRQAHLAASRLVGDVLAAGAGDPVDDAKAALAAGFLLDAAAPTNFLVTNPAALKRAFETGGPAWRPGPGTWSTTCSTTAAGRARSTSGRLPSARTLPRLRGRSCSGTT
jgi:polyhydroxyalkanoate synthase